jgi:hypothetical protein
MEWIYKKIWELKSKALTLENKARIQQLQQLLDGDKNVSTSNSASEKKDKNNSANSLKLKANKNDSSNDTNIEEDINTFLFNRYNR